MLSYMQRLALLLLALFATLAVYGQTEIRMEKSKFYEGRTLLKPGQVLDRMRSKPEAFNEFKKAKSNYDAGQVLGFTGGFLIGWPLGTALGGGDPQWGMAAGGAALLLLTIPLQSGFKRHAQNALTIYNGDPLARDRVNLHFRFHATAASLILKL
jgi:hypothetical protein